MGLGSLVKKFAKAWVNPGGALKDAFSHGGGKGNNFSGFVGTPGTGASFFDNIGYGGRSLSNPGDRLDQLAGGKHDFNGPFLAAAFLKDQMGPTGYLSDAQSSLEAAGDVNDIFNQGNQEYRSTLSALGQSGLVERYAVPAANLSRIGAGRAASTRMATANATTTARRYDAQQAFLNMLIQTGLASKTGHTQELIANNAAQKTENAGLLAGVGNLIGAGIGAFGATKKVA